MWNRQNLVQWILGLLLTATLAIAIPVWNNYRAKIATKDEKIENLDAQNADLKLANVKYEMELQNATREIEELKETNKGLSRQLRWRNR